MTAAAVTALGDLLSPGFRGIVLKAIGLTLLLFAALVTAITYAFGTFVELKWSWAETAAQWGLGLATVAGLFFLIVPVSAIFAGLYFDRVAELTEQRHYAADAPGRAPQGFSSFITGIQFALLALLVSILVFPTIFFGIGVVALPLANAYVLSREYFVMAAARHVGLDQAKALRRGNALRVWSSGVIPALLAMVPFANLAVPVFAASYYVHVAKRVVTSSP